MPATATTAIHPEILDFVKQLALYVLIAFAVMIAGAAFVYSKMISNEHFTGINMARILHEADVPKMTTIILIVCATSLLAVLGIVSGEAAIALLSAIAGYVLGDRVATSKSSPS